MDTLINFLIIGAGISVNIIGLWFAGYVADRVCHKFNITQCDEGYKDRNCGKKCNNPQSPAAEAKPLHLL
ncbi:MAG: hypothetical protein OXI43_16540 [Candidatus Poribacteria bacterium]|nr:hypothetical protein [Candidatus Poribacteria bacterium]